MFSVFFLICFNIFVECYQLGAGVGCPDSLSVTYTFDGSDPLQDITRFNSPAVNLTCPGFDCFFDFGSCPGAVEGGHCARGKQLFNRIDEFPSFVLDLPGDDFTILMRVRMSSCGSTGKTLLSRTTPGALPEVHLLCTSTGIFGVRLLDGSNNAKNLNAGGRFLNDDQWHTVALVLARESGQSAASSHLWFDGFKVVNSNQAQTGYADPTGVWRVGAGVDSVDPAVVLPFEDGEIDEVMIFASSLEDSLLMAMFGELAAGRRACFAPELPSGLPNNGPAPPTSTPTGPAPTKSPTAVPTPPTSSPYGPPLTESPTAMPTPTVRLLTTPAPTSTVGSTLVSAFASQSKTVFASSFVSEDHNSMVKEKNGNVDDLNGPTGAAQETTVGVVNNNVQNETGNQPGQDLFPALVGGVASLFGLLLLVAVAVFIRRRRRRGSSMHDRVEMSSSVPTAPRSRSRSRARSGSRSRRASRSITRQKSNQNMMGGMTVYGNFRDIVDTNPDYARLPSASSSSYHSTNVYSDFSAPEVENYSQFPIGPSDVRSVSSSNAYDQFQAPDVKR